MYVSCFPDKFGNFKPLIHAGGQAVEARCHLFEVTSLDQDVDPDLAFVPSALTYGSTPWASTEPVLR
ncbi:hypothetical protein MRX96_008192 [Rhipicephalus microplus]